MKGDLKIIDYYTTNKTNIQANTLHALDRLHRLRVFDTETLHDCFVARENTKGREPIEYHVYKNGTCVIVTVVSRQLVTILNLRPRQVKDLYGAVGMKPSRELKTNCEINKRRCRYKS